MAEANTTRPSNEDLDITMNSDNIPPNPNNLLELWQFALDPNIPGATAALLGWCRAGRIDEILAWLNRRVAHFMERLTAMEGIFEVQEDTIKDLEAINEEQERLKGVLEENAELRDRQIIELREMVDLLKEQSQTKAQVQSLREEQSVLREQLAAQ